MPGWPVKMSDSNVEIQCSPLLGQHTEEVLSSWAGMSESEIAGYMLEMPVKIGKK
jgi:crotonobetainyl-CoA:carnitine CoA-transferase CaiB-like acyl-CoA transferase